MEQYEGKGYNGAPYNFVGISDRVYKKDRLQPHNRIEKDRKSGRIQYKITAETPIFVGCGKRQGEEEDFYKNCYGKYAVPGSTLRGLVRGNVQILSCSSVKEDISDGHLMYRKEADETPLGKYYGELLGIECERIPQPDGSKLRMSVAKKVRAGYIRNTGKGYELLKTKADAPENEKRNYEILSERKIIESGYRGFEYLREIELQHTKDSVFERVKEEDKVQYKGEENEAYVPDSIPVSYKTGEEGTVTAVAEKGTLSLNGYLLLSGYAKQKKAIYLIPEIDETNAMAIPKPDIDCFIRDYEGRKGKIRKTDREFYQLPAKGETKPVFYIMLDGRWYFGFTPRIRILYKKRILEGLGEEYSGTSLDYSKSIFGFSNIRESYKTRVYFLDAVIQQGENKREMHSALFRQPHPASYLNYLEGKDGGPANYNDEFRLRGVKQYWLKQCPVSEEESEKEETCGSEINAFEKGTSFRGEIRFSNLTEEELGLLLWGLLLEKDSQQNIGRGKAYGYGRISVELLKLEIQNKEELYSGTSLCLQPYVDETERRTFYVDAAKAEMKRFLGCDIMEVPQIRDFFLMKDKNRIPPNSKTRYMTKGREYEERDQNQEMLPSVEEVINGTKSLTEETESGILVQE